MKRIITVSTIAMIIASFAAVAVAGDRGRRGKRMKGDRIMKMAGELDLTADQQVMIKKIHDEKRAESQPLRQQIHDLKREQRIQWSATSPDEKAILSLQEQVNALKEELVELRFASRMDTLAVLTPEQRAKLAELKAERRAKGKRKGKRFGKKGRGRGYSQSMSGDPAVQ